MKLRLRCLLVCGMLLVMAGSNFAQSGASRARQNESAKVESAQMELIIFARFHTREGKEEAVAAELRDAVTRVSSVRRGRLAFDGILANVMPARKLDNPPPISFASDAAYFAQSDPIP
jgi:hypothetical protein